MILGFIAVGSVTFFYEDTIKKFPERNVHYALLAVPVIIILWLLNLIQSYSSMGGGNNLFG